MAVHYDAVGVDELGVDAVEVRLPGEIDEVDARLRTRMLDLQRCRVWGMIVPSYRGSPARRATRRERPKRGS